MSIKEGQRIKGYSRQILKYCDVNNIDVPVGFHNRNTSKLALIELGDKVKKLIALTFDYDGEAISFLDKEEHKKRKYKILNFKNCTEYKYKGESRLEKFQPFEGYREYYKF